MAAWIILTLLSAVFFSIKDIIAKKLFRKNVAPGQLIFEEFFLMILVTLLVFSHKISFSSIFDVPHLYLLKAVAIGASAFIYFNLLEYHEISVVSPLTNLSPLILLLLSTTILSEVLTSLQLLGVFVMIIFTYYFETIIHAQNKKKKDHKFHFKELFQKDWKFFFGVISMLIAFSFAAISDKLIFKEGVSVFSNMFFTGVLVFIAICVYYFVKGDLWNAFRYIYKEPETLLVGIFVLLSNYLILFAISIPSAMVSLIIPLRRTSTLFSSVFGGMIFHDDHIRKKTVAVTGMLIGVFLITL